MEHVNRMFDQANLVELPPSYEARQDPARMLVLVFFLLFPGVCMTIVAGVMLSDTVEWARWQRRVPGFMRFMETALRWRTIPFCVLGAATGVLAVAVVRQYLDVNNRFVAWLVPLSPPLVSPPSLSVSQTCVLLCILRFAQCHPLEDGDCAGILAMAPILFTLAVGSILSTSCCFLAGWSVVLPSPSRLSCL